MGMVANLVKWPGPIIIDCVGGLMTCQLLWNILCCLPEREKRDELEMKEKE